MKFWRRFSTVTPGIEIVLVFAALIGLPVVAFAQTLVSSGQVVITEIMYDVPGADPGREWIEVYNTGAAPVALTAWKVFENGTNHKITAASGSSALAPQTYAVIADNAAKFRADHPQFIGQLFNSAFNLGNTGDSIALRDASSTTIESISYDSGSGASGDGNSLNREPGNTGAFVPRTPSPGAAMSAAAIPPPPDAKASADTKVLADRSAGKPAPKQATLIASSPPARAPAARIARKATVHANTSAPNNAIIGDAAVQGNPAPPNTDVSPVAQAATPLFPASSKWWWIGAAALALLGGGAMVASRSKAKSEWNIVEQKG